MSAARTVLRALEQRTAIEFPVALVAAHPDDETIGAGASMALFRQLMIVHVTDGAPRDLNDAHTRGFGTGARYAAARREELARALAAGSVMAACAELGAVDQEASLHLAELANSLAGVLAPFRPVCVISHAYEGGHPDHDAACLITRLACTRLDPPPAILEMTGYFANVDGETIIGGFVGEPAALVAVLSAEERARRMAMLDCFVTQRETLLPFREMEHEAFRLAPPCDFTAAPHPGALKYERAGFGMTGARWRELARQALAEWGV